MTRNLFKRALKLAQNGDYLDAGDLYRDLGEYDRAINLYIKSRAYSRSAPLLERMGRKREAARHFSRARQYTKAAEILKDLKSYYEAGMMYKEARIPVLAAEMFEKGGAFSDAAGMYEEAKDYRKAGKLYLDRGMYGKATLCFQKILRSVYYSDKVTEDGVPIKQEVGILCAKAFEKLKKFNRAAELYSKTFQVDDAVRVCRESGHLEKAATYLEEAGRLKEASAIYAEIGQQEKARHLEIENLMTNDKFHEAATLADDSGEFVVAAEAYEIARDYERAGEMYRLIGKPLKAADMFLQADKKLEAAILFERAGKLREAAELREQIGEFDKAAELFSLVNEYKKSGELYLVLQKYDEAIRVLQNAWSQGEQTVWIRNMLGMAFLRRGNFDLAYDNYLKYLLEEPVTDRNQSLVYELGAEFEKRGQPERALKLFERLSAFDLEYRDVKRSIDRLQVEVQNISQKSGSTAFPHQLTPGRQVAQRYVIKEKVGSGGMGVVYRARDKELGLEVALKVLKPKYARDQEMIQRFKQEVTLARRIFHDNVVQLYDFDKVDDVLYICMEFFPSRDLKAIIRSQGRLGVEEIIPLMTQVCSGLWAAHQRGIVHRDIKPQNILVNDERAVKLVDFGIAIAMGPADSKSADEFVVGTPEYMSPEQAKGEVTDTRSDIYSLGTILYEAATGQPPFVNKDSFQVLVDQVEKPPVPPNTRVPEIPGWLNDLILKCLAKDPDSRYESVQVIERQLATSGIAELMLSIPDEDDDDEYFL